jgi:F0F1-type ATP synthase assembly protein I
MNDNDDLLDFLVEGLVGKQRDLVTRAFYYYAEGDPRSGPVNEAVLHTAYARRVAQAPRELRDANGDFRKLLGEGREMEARIRERVELSNAGVVASVKDEGNRIASSLRTASQNHAEIVSEGRKIAGLMRELFTQGEALLTELRQIKVELKTNGEAAKNIAEATENTKATSQSTKEIVSTLANAAGFNWLSVGVTIGFILTFIATQLPWYLALALFALAIGMIQAIGRAFWKSIRRKSQQMRT